MEIQEGDHGVGMFHQQPELNCLYTVSFSANITIILTSFSWQTNHSHLSFDF